MINKEIKHGNNFQIEEGGLNIRMKKVNSLFNEKQRYSIRKYHIGAASIIIGSVVFMNTGSLSYASEVDNKASEIVENEIHTNKERISNIDTAV